jgi:hypothetical protein
MPTADWFVSAANGNDGSDGTSWSNAKATVAAGLALVDGTSQIVAIAPGYYNENLTDPPQAGGSGAWNELTGDPWGVYTDGTSATHGENPDNVVLYQQTTKTIQWSSDRDNYNFWRIRNIVACCIDDTAIQINPQPENFEMYDTYMWSGAGRGFLMAGGTTNTMLGVLYRCVGIGALAGIYVRADRSAFSDNPTAECYSCVGVGTGHQNSASHLSCGFYLGAVDTNTKTFAKLNNCSGFGYNQVSPFSAGIGGNTAMAANNKLTAIRCYAEGYHGIKYLTHDSSVDNYTNKHTSGTNDAGIDATLSNVPTHFPEFARLLMSSADLIAEGADFSGELSGDATYDVLGNLLVDCVGPEEYVDDGHLIAPIGFDHGNGNRGIGWTNDPFFTRVTSGVLGVRTRRNVLFRPLQTMGGNRR